MDDLRLGALEGLLVHRHDVDRARLQADLELLGSWDRPRMSGKIVPVTNGMPIPGAMPVAVVNDSMASWMMPQPIW